MAQRDFYDVLGVARGSSADDIRKAYRGLARKLHPDVNKSADAQKKFTEIQSAYDVLGDEAKKARYDELGHSAFEAGGGGSAPPRGGRQGWPGGQGSANTNVEFDESELGDMFETFFGGGMGGMGRGGPRAGGRPRAAEPSRHEVRVDFTTVAQGGTQKLRVSDGEGARTIEVKIPQGVEAGAQLRVKAAGGKRGGGDLILTIQTDPHPLFRRGEHAETGKGLDLYLDLPLTIAEATLGGAVTVPTLAGPVELAIPAATASGRKLRLRARGLLDESGRHGDLYALVRIVPPTNPLTPEQANDLRALAGPSPRQGPGWEAP